MNGSTFEDRFIRNFSWCKAYFERKTKEFGIVGWTLDLDSSKSHLGLTSYGEKKVYISVHFLKGATCGEKEIRNTVLHELAHVLVGPVKRPHGKEWKRMALKIGCDGKTCSHMDRPDAKYLMYCTNGCQKISMYRKSKNAEKYNCGKCGQHTLVWKTLR